MKQKIVLAGLLIALAFFMGVLVGRRSLYDQSSEKVVTLRDLNEEIINPLVDVEVPETIGEGKIKTIIQAINDSSKSSEDNGAIQRIGVYFRDLKEGAWYGYHESELFAPASLLKVPVMIAYLKMSENNPAVLSEMIPYDDTYPLPDQNLGMDFAPEKTVVKGKSYSVDDLLSYMIIYSDNNAKNLLLLHLDEKKLNDVYSDLGMNSVATAGPTSNILSVKDTATAYRVLYNATYLSNANSRKAINLLLGDRFTEGIVKGLPGGTRYAGKYGERSFDTVRQLHDCGIVYYPSHPYILCIMTEGTDYSQLLSTIESISHNVYTAFDKAHHK